MYIYQHYYIPIFISFLVDFIMTNYSAIINTGFVVINIKAYIISYMCIIILINFIKGIYLLFLLTSNPVAYQNFNMTIQLKKIQHFHILANNPWIQYQINHINLQEDYWTIIGYCIL